MKLEFPAPLTERTFLERYWQKKPLFMPGGLPTMQPVIAADELAWLATQPDVESRLIRTARAPGRTHYRVEHGPFSARRLQRLPKEDWTLLVHDVDKHLPDFRGWLDAAPFVPDWRVDDLMMSVAAPGGSVGPHRDHYDVFLCQVQGVRDWHLAEPGQVAASRHRGALALLEPFESAPPILAAPADVLYLPPGVPHWGIARDLCITCSLGMRAPNRRELGEAHRRLAPCAGDSADSETSEGVFYTDPDLKAGESGLGEIGRDALERAARLLGLPVLDRQRLARAFGSVVTTPKASVAPDLPDPDETAALTARVIQTELTRVHGMARLAWCEPGAGPALVFVNGLSRSAGRELLVEFRNLCSRRVLTAGQCGIFLRSGGGSEFLDWLVASGTFDLTDVEE